MSVPIDITDDTLASSLVPVQCASLAPPAVLKNLGLEVLRLFRRYAHTLLLRTVFANSDVECILRAKTLQLYLTGMGQWTGPRKFEKFPSPWLVLDARVKSLPPDIDLKFIGSSLVWKLFQNDRGQMTWNEMKRLGGSWVSHVPSWGNKTDAGTSSWRWTQSQWNAVSPLRENRFLKFYIYSDGSHTHTL